MPLILQDARDASVSVRSDGGCVCRDGGCVRRGGGGRDTDDADGGDVSCLFLMAVRCS